MNLLGKIVKPPFLLVFLTACFLASLFFLYDPASGQMQNYTITAAQRASQPVTLEKPAPVDINTATPEELQTLAGIGAVMAQRIIDYRMEHGAFVSVEDLLNVNGIGAATLEKFRARVTVSETSGSETPDGSEISGEPETEKDGTSPEQETQPEREEPEPPQEPENSGKASAPPEETGEIPRAEETDERDEQESTGETALIDLNTATQEELQLLHGIGEVIAQRIIDYREEHGAFTCVEDLLNIKGIGAATLEKFRAQVTVSGQSGEENPEQARECDTNEQPPQESGRLDLNTATREELQTLHGIGEVLAQRIIDYRAERGAFTCVEELLNIKGIGEATLKKLIPYVTVSAAEQTTVPEEESE